MSASGMPLTLYDGRLTRILEGTDDLNVQSVVPENTDANLHISSNGAGELRFSIGGTRAVTIDSSRRVGIGTDTPTLARLQVEVPDSGDTDALYVRQLDSTNGDKSALIIENEGNPALGSSSILLKGSTRYISAIDDGVSNHSMNFMNVAYYAAPAGVRYMNFYNFTYTDNDVRIRIHALQQAAGAGEGQIDIDAEDWIRIGDSVDTVRIGQSASQVDICYGGSTTGTINIGSTGSHAKTINLMAGDTGDIDFTARGHSYNFNSATNASLSRQHFHPTEYDSSLIGILNQIGMKNGRFSVLRMVSDADQGGSPPGAAVTGEAYEVNNWGGGYTDGQIQEKTDSGWSLVEHPYIGSSPAKVWVVIDENTVAGSFSTHKGKIAYSESGTGWTIVTPYEGWSAVIVGNGSAYKNSMWVYDDDAASWNRIGGSTAYDSLTVTVDSGTAVSQWDIVGAFTSGTGEVRLSEADGATNPKNVVGVALTAGAIGADIAVATTGVVYVRTSDAGAWTIGNPVFMSTTEGEVSNDVSGLSVGNVNQQVGYALDSGTGSTRKIFLSIGPVVVV